MPYCAWYGKSSDVQDGLTTSEAGTKAILSEVMLLFRESSGGVAKMYRDMEDKRIVPYLGYIDHAE